MSGFGGEDGMVKTWVLRVPPGKGCSSRVVVGFFLLYEQCSVSVQAAVKQ